MTDTPTVDTINRLQREAEKILRELGLALEQALLSFKEPAGAARPYETRYQALVRDIEQAVRLTPQAREFLTRVQKHLRKEMDGLLERANRAHRSRGQVRGDLGQRYNELVGGALGSAPSQGVRALEGQIDSQVRRLVDQVVGDKDVPSNVRSQMARSLSTWLRQQEPMEDAFFVLQSALTDVSGFIHEKLTIRAEIVDTRKRITASDTVSPTDAQAADQRVGELAKRSTQLDQRIESQIAQNALRVRTNVRFSPKLVLDPARYFLKSLDAQAGITITQNDVKVELGTRLRVTDPLSSDRNIAINPYVKGSVGPNMNFGVEYSNSFQNGQPSGHQVKATLSWRF